MTTTTTTTSSSKRSSSSTKDGNALLVAVVDRTVSKARKEAYAPVTLRCPNTGKDQDYLLLTLANDQHHLLEIQCLDGSSSAPKSYSSWFVGNRVVSNGKLYVLTRVDPLFFVLPTSPSEMSTQWQPMDQLLPLCTTLAKVLDPRQLQHLCQSYEMDEDEIFYKFSKAKTLEWLTRKQQSVHQVLLTHYVAAREREEKATAAGGGAFAKDFCLASESKVPDAVETDSNSSASSSEDMKARAKRESLQIVCNYLSSDWRTAFLEHMDSNASVLKEEEEPTHNKRAKTEELTSSSPITAEECRTTATVTPAPLKKEEEKPPTPKLSFGQKQLLKVNKKGMKSMTSFFAVKKKG